MTLDQAHIKTLLDTARDVREKAYAPYSEFKVGAAALAASGKIYTGCNIENASYGLTICAERVAITKAISDGEREIRAIAVVAGEEGIARPCGACLQVIAEFSPKDEPTVVIASSVSGEYDAHTIDEYLPMCFKLEGK